MKEARLFLTNFHKCAFCTHWGDFSSSYIKPKDLRRQLWTYDDKAKCYCDKKRTDKSADYGCTDFECKV